MAKLKITGTKAILNEVVFREKCQEHASQMKENAIRKAPKDTRKLKKEGIDKEDTDTGSKVFLNTNDVPYGLYQELGWKNSGVHPGKFFMEHAFQLECAKAGLDAKAMMKKAITVEGSNGYDIVEYRRKGVNGGITERKYK
ncbi:MAG: hypothetical protein MSA15_21265 [Clostridium sp.]|nr:hypothetical protein [Clostridium sp.]